MPNTSTSTNTSQAIHPKTKRPTSLISQNKQISYTYDSHGNIKTKTETPIDKQGNQIAQSQNGLVGYRKSIEFSYNSNNELAKTLTLEDTGLTITKTTTQYHYDAFGRRIAKNSKVERLNKLNQNGQLVRYPTTLLHLSKTQKTQYQTTLMLWEGNRQLQEYTNHHIFTTVYDQDSFEPVSRLVQSRDKTCDDLKIYHYHNNHLGTPQELTDENGEVVWANYEFAWGGSYQSYYKEQSLNNIPIDKDHLQPIKFQGQFFDTETSLHYNRFRYYDSDVGMFISRDPIGLLGGVNVYQYVSNPTLFIDPFGLRSLKSYGCIDDAGRAALKSANPKSIRLNKEYGGLIYEKGGRYFHTVPIPGTKNTFKIASAKKLIPKGAKVVGDYHTHGDYSRRDGKNQLIRTTAEFDTENSNNFSDSDRKITRMAQSQNPCHRSYLGTPSGKFKASSLLRGEYEL